MNTVTAGPEKQFELRTFAAVSQCVTVGDIYKGKIVTEVKTGRKWVYISLDGGPVVEVEIGIDVRVQRQVETDESKERGDIYARETWIIRQVSNWKSATPAAMEDIATTVAKGYQISSFQLDALVRAQASDKVWARYVNVVNNCVEKHEMTFYAAHLAYREELQSQVLSKAAGGCYRSSSVISNVMEECDLAAAATFLRDSRF